MENPEAARPPMGGRNLIGAVLAGRYRVDRVVSEELLGHVYVGTDDQARRKVLVKVLHQHLAHDDARFGRFLREVRATSMVRHANTIEILDSGSQDGVHFLVMEYFPSHTLEDEMKGGILPVERVAHIAAQVASAIGAAHQESVQHRALSPRNVLLVEGVRHGDLVKVRDFGLSKLEKFDAGNDEASHLTEAGVRVGNTAYMSPEYIERDRFHPKGDLYALGCLMFAMLTGRPPYTGRAADVLTAHVTARIPRPSSLNEAVPGWMDEVVVALLAKSPEDRPGAYQVVQRLEDGAGRRLGAPDPHAPPPPDPDAEQEGPKVPYAVLGGMAVMMGLMAVLAATLIVGAVFLLMTWNVTSQVVVAEAPATTAPAAAAPAPAPDPVELPAPAAPEPSAPVAPGPRPAPAPVDPASVPIVEGPVATGKTTVHVVSNRRVLVYLNGTPKGYAPLDLPVPPGIHRVAAALPGQSDSKQEEQIQVRKGETPTITFTF